MIAGTATPRLDLTAGLLSRRKVESPTDSSESLVSKKKLRPKIDLTGGLVVKAKVWGAEAAASRPHPLSPPPGPSPLANTVQASAGAVPAKSGWVNDAPAPAAKPQAPGVREPTPTAAETEIFGWPVAAEAADVRPIMPVSQPAISSEARAGARPPVAPAMRGRDLQSVPSPVRERERQTVEPAAGPVKSVPIVGVPTPLESAPSLVDANQSETVPRPLEVQEPEENPYEETPYGAATRMSGLRNLLLSLGMKNLSQHSGDTEIEHPASSSIDSFPRQGYTRPAAHAEPDSVESSPTLVTAPPEFLPPKAVDESAEERSPLARDAIRRDRRETYDDVEVLPSWRGQYRRKPR